jgi:hypothetical protein
MSDITAVIAMSSGSHKLCPHVVVCLIFGPFFSTISIWARSAFVVLASNSELKKEDEGFVFQVARASHSSVVTAAPQAQSGLRSIPDSCTCGTVRPRHLLQVATTAVRITDRG